MIKEPKVVEGLFLQYFRSTYFVCRTDGKLFWWRLGETFDNTAPAASDGLAEIPSEEMVWAWLPQTFFH